MTQAWVVLLEAASDGPGRRIDLDSIEDLLRLLKPFSATALYAPDRYALQLVVEDADPEGALEVGAARWRDAVLRTGAPDWELVRAEVKTLDELEAEHSVNGGADHRPKDRKRPCLLRPAWETRARQPLPGPSLGWWRGLGSRAGDGPTACDSG